MSPVPRAMHQRAVAALLLRVHPYVARHRLGVTGLFPADLLADHFREVWGEAR